MHLTYTDRLTFEALYNKGVSIKEIARILGKHISTVYREVKRGIYTHKNSDWTTRKAYSCDKAQNDANYNRLSQGKRPKADNDAEFIDFIRTMIRKKYSPLAITYYIRENDLHFSTSVCRGTIYNYIHKGYIYGISEIDLPRCKPRKQKVPHKTQKRQCVGASIDARPVEILDRTEFGHWEMDSIIGRRESGETLVCFTERKTRTELIFRANGKTAASTVTIIDAIKQKCGKHFEKVFKTITCDNGCEFSDYQSMRDFCAIYYCHPYSSWERGSNENQNGFIRRFFPKGTKVETLTDEEMHYIQCFLNRYPRSLFGGKSSIQMLEKCTSKTVFHTLQKFF